MIGRKMPTAANVDAVRSFLEVHIGPGAGSDHRHAAGPVVARLRVPPRRSRSGGALQSFARVL